MPMLTPVGLRDLRGTNRKIVVLWALLLTACLMFVTAASTAWASEVTVSQTDDLVDGQTVSVQGAGFDEERGIYVGVCLFQGEGERATPCIGGIDMEGEGGSSYWISSNPPAYGEGLAIPFEAGGSFEVDLMVVASDEISGVDCRVETCVITIMSDHTNLTDRSLDQHFPVTFAPAGTPLPDETDTGADSGAAEQDASGEADTGEAERNEDSAEPSEEIAEKDETQADGEDAAAEQNATDDRQSRDPAKTGSAAMWWWALPALVLLAAVIWLATRRNRSALDEPQPDQQQPDQQ